MNIILTYLYFDGEFFFSMVDFADKLKRIKDKISNNDKLREELADIYKSGALKRWSEALKDISKEEFPTVDMSSHLQATDSAVCSYLISLFTSDKEYKTGVATISEYISIDTVSMLNVRTGEKIASSKSGNCFIVDTFTFSDDDTDFQILISYSVLQIKNEILCCSLGSGGENIAIIDSDTSKKNVIGISLNQKVKRELMSETISKDSLKYLGNIYIQLISEKYTEKITINCPFRQLKFKMEAAEIKYDMVRIPIKSKDIYVGMWPLEIENTNEWLTKDFKTPIRNQCYVTHKVFFWLNHEIRPVKTMLKNISKATGYNVRLPSPEEFKYLIQEDKTSNICNDSDILLAKGEMREALGEQDMSVATLSTILPKNRFGIYGLQGCIPELLESSGEYFLKLGDWRNFVVQTEFWPFEKAKIELGGKNIIFGIRLITEIK